MEMYRSGRNENDSKSEWMLRRGLHITRGNVNFDVLTGFKACLNDAFSNNILTATIPSFKADLRYTNRKFAMKIYLEMYRSGRNENDSKSFCP